MKRTITFKGQGARPSLSLNKWLNKHTEAELITAQITGWRDTVLLLAVVDVPGGTTIYEWEKESEDSGND